MGDGRWRRVVRGGLAGLGGLAAVAGLAGVGVGAVAAVEYRAIRDEAVAMARAHQDHAVSHPGWSFPGTVWSAPQDLEGLPPARAALHAQARGYVAACPPAHPGEYCAATGAVVPRGGRFPEGDQPPGREGWTRPLAFEPVALGILSGPDGELRWHLPREEAPEHLVAAILASEDAGFYDHPGVDLAGIARAAVRNAQGVGAQQGASTLTMQLVRNLTQHKDRTVTRKLREIARAVAVDGALGKDAVLAMYLDAPYLGQHGSWSVCGFEAAARYYWGKPARELTLAQSATLAAILPAPGKFAPDRDPEAAKARRDRLLERMGELGWDVEAALAEPMGASPHALVPPERFATYLQATRLAVDAALPPEVAYGAGLDVFTGLDVAAQWRSEQLLDERVRYLERTIGRRGAGPLTAAGALVDPATGLLVAAHDTNQAAATDFSRVTQARRQAGSSMKPLVYALAFSPGPDGHPLHRSDDTVPNAVRTFPGTDGWRPRNVAGRYTATSTYAYGLAASMNIATASVLEQSGGPEALIRLADRIGFDTAGFPRELGLALGQGEVTPLEMARFVGTVVGGGRRLAASPLAKVVDVDGTVVFEAAGPGEQVLTPEAALLTRELMWLVVRGGTGGGVHGGGGFSGYAGDIVGKTGTSNDEKDLWFIAGTPAIAGALWVGYDEPVRVGGSASDLAAPLFGWWLAAATEGLPQPKFPDEGFDKRYVCNQTGLVPGAGCVAFPAPLLPGQVVRGVCNGAHAPETGVPMGEYQSLWDKLAAAAEAPPGTPPPDGEPQD